MPGDPILSEAHWARIEPLLPGRESRGRPWRDNRQVLEGILWVLPVRGLAGRTCPTSKGDAVGKTKRGKGTKCKGVVDGQGVPLGTTAHSASPAEVQLLEATLATVRVPRAGPGRPCSRPERVIADRAYDSDPLRRRLGRRGIELIAPHRRDRRRPKTQVRPMLVRPELPMQVFWLQSQEEPALLWTTVVMPGDLEK